MNRFFNRPYLSNGRAIGTSCRLSVLPSVCHRCIVPNLYIVGENFTRIISHVCVKLGYAKFQPSSLRETFLNSGLNGWGKNMRFSTEDRPHL